MSPEQILTIANELLNSDVAFEADLVSLDTSASDREKQIAALVVQLYRLVHPHFSTCSHPDWEEENKKLLT